MTKDILKLSATLLGLDDVIEFLDDTSSSTNQETQNQTRKKTNNIINKTNQTAINNLKNNTNQETQTTKQKGIFRKHSFFGDRHARRSNKNRNCKKTWRHCI